MEDQIIADITQYRPITNTPDAIEDSKLNNNLIQYSKADSVNFGDFLNLEKINPNMYSLETFKSKIPLKYILLIIGILLILCCIVYFARQQNNIYYPRL